MKVFEPGFVADRILFLGPRQTATSLVMGDRYALIGGGVAWGVASLEEQLDRFGVDRSRLRFLVVSHSHHDHCGAVPYLLRAYPWLEVLGSPYCAHILAKPAAVELIRGLNATTLDHLGRPHDHAGVPVDFEAVTVTRVVGDGEELSLGAGLTLRFLHTPGHSRCSLSVYVPERKALFPGDALPHPEPGTSGLRVTANHDYSEYLASLEKLLPLPLDVVAFEHGGVWLGDDAVGLVDAGLTATREQRVRLQRRCTELGSVERLVEETAAKYGELDLFRHLSPEALRAIVGRMVRSAVGQL
ncbi:MAG: MBL fold metallo-hydrolase [Proteobacteria bacterium]|nr:MBL fold metallo-hydrolase [Pseudomonadota bacterium]